MDSVIVYTKEENISSGIMCSIGVLGGQGTDSGHATGFNN